MALAWLASWVLEVVSAVSASQVRPTCPQEVSDVPAEPHDRPLRFVITEAEVIRFDRTA